MSIDTAALAKQLAAEMIKSLGRDTGKVKGLANSEAQSLALAFRRIADLLEVGQIDTDEAATLVRIQKDASEAVLASLEEISRVAAHRAVNLALRGIAGTLDSITGLPLARTALQVATLAAE
jgi:hypothetical protein